jgi:sulfur carrier protein ThiS adenylyltransferase
MSDEPIDQIYARQHSLTVTPPDHVVIVGCGGVGTWAAIFLALAGTKNMVLIDSDLVEIHNLNRTLFRPYHVGMKKVDALHELLLDIRPTLTVETYPMRSDNIPAMIRDQWTSHVVLDCRDEI